MHERNFYSPRLRLIPDYMTVIIIGIPLGIVFALLLALGRIKINGYGRALRLVARGKVIIAANHPSMLETFLIPLLFFPLYLVHLRFFVWSVPDRRLLNPALRWLFWFARCVTLDRSDQNSKKPALYQLTEILEHNGIIVIHPEAGRTSKGEKFVTRGDRRMRVFISGVPSLAQSTHTTILPLWVSGTDSVLPIGMIIPRLMRSKIVFSFGMPYNPFKGRKDRNQESRILANAILAS